jgi:hydrogenase-4 membrane subunit HyfE
MDINFSQLLLELFFLTIIFLHIVKKNFNVAILYGAQSFAVVLLMIVSFFENADLYVLLAACLMLLVKVILAPVFMTRLVKKHQVKFSGSAYANTPLTIIIVAALFIVARSQVFAPLVDIVPENFELLSLALGALFASFFLIVNRKGVISQIIGILSLENSIVVFAIFAGLEQSPALQVGILFDISLWLVIATVFTSMIYKQFGSLDITSMTHLKD